jgi:hypothetical protein
MKLFEGKYSGESLYDVGRDVSEAFDADFNPIVAQIPSDEYGFQEGTFKVTIEWSSTEYFPDETAEELCQLSAGENVVLPKSKEHAESMLRVAQFYLDNIK